MKLLDRLCAGILFIVAIVECLMVPKTYAGRIWIFGTDLALLFTSLLNLLRIRSGYRMPGLKMFCITTDIVMLIFFLGLMASIGWAVTRANPYLLAVTGLLAIATVFALGKND